jgi:RNA polymerase sigma-70 factor (ECF subfamily)
MDSKTFKQNFLPLHPKLYRIAFAMTGNSFDAEDVLQDAYLRLWNKREELEDIRSAEAFCITMVKRLCLDVLRAARPQDNLDNVQLSADLSPEKEVVEKDMLQTVQGLIDRLPTNQRQVLRLSCIDGCTQEEIEEITGLTGVNVRVLLSRARKTIKEKVNKLL